MFVFSFGRPGPADRMGNASTGPRHRRRIAGLLLGFNCMILLASAPVHAQSFLEKLEKAVRSQLESPGKTAPPSPAGGDSAASLDDRPGKQAAVDAPDELPPPAPAPVGGPGESAPSQTGGPQATGQIYLGLEVEAPNDNRLGVRVTDVDRDGPAWKAGFRPGDRILAVNGYALGDIEDMVQQFAKLKPGDSVRFLVNRNGANREMTAVLMDAGLAADARNRRSAEKDAEKGWLGVTTVDLTEAFRQRFGVGVFRGAAITSVEAGSPAKTAGLKPGDTIVEVDGTPIETADALATWIDSAQPGRTIELLFYRGAFPRRVEVTLARRPETRSVLDLSNGAPAGLRPSPPSTSTLEPPTSPAVPVTPPPADEGTDLADEVARLRVENAALRKEINELNAQLKRTRDQLDGILRSLQSVDR